MPFTKKPYREASFRHVDISGEIKTPWADRIYRRFFHRELLNDDGRAELLSRRFSLLIKISAAIAVIWFIFETISAWNIFE